ncbi:MAG: ribosomal protein S18-alanine N-acetyltransferase [Lachnospiraceae bacterium]|nr:ribosomal protein S18-alanine N-acetyltransferase [Lachnospiraceae bacterium]
MNSIQIRKMEPGDIPAVAALEREIFSEPWGVKGFSDALAQDNTIFLTARSPDGGIAGFAGLYAAADECEITNVAVAEEYRCRGIATGLLAVLLEQARGHGVSRFFLEVRVSNQAAVSLYEKFGFRVLKTRKGFYRMPTEDALLMCCVSDSREMRDDNRACP